MTTLSVVDNEDALVSAARAGDTDAFGRIYDIHSPSLHALAIRIMGDKEAAADLTHDVFLEAFRTLESYSPARGSLRAWLVVKLRSRAFDRMKSAGYRIAMRWASDGEVDERSAYHDASEADRIQVKQMLSTLTPEHRYVLELVYFEGLSSAEVATRLGIPIGTVKSRVARAIAEMRRGQSKEGQA